MPFNIVECSYVLSSLEDKSFIIIKNIIITHYIFIFYTVYVENVWIYTLLPRQLLLYIFNNTILCAEC